MPSVNVLVVEKTGEIRSLKIKDYVESELYKKAGFKSSEGFKLQTSWAVNVEGVEHKVLLFAKATGKAGGENKYDFPPPVDATLFFGACVLVGVRAGQPADLTPDQWSKFYEFLFGGFEDLGEEDTEEELETDDEIDQMEKVLEKELGKPVKIQTTKQGYMKDDFIVDDDEVEEDEMSDDSYVEPKKKSSRGSKAKKSSEGEEETVEKKNEKKERKKREPKSNKKTKDVAQTIIEEPTQTQSEYLDCTTELTYEEYHK